MLKEPGLLEPVLGGWLPWLYTDTILWTVFGLLGNFVFSLRFIIQWITSEREQSVVVPPIFWYLSFWGSLLSLIYAFHIDKLPVILGYVALPLIYFRNLVLLKKDEREKSG